MLTVLASIIYLYAVQSDLSFLPVQPVLQAVL